MLNQQNKDPNETEPAMKIRGYQNFVWPYLFIIAAHPGSAEYHSVDVTYPQQNIYTSLKTPDEGAARALPRAAPQALSQSSRQTVRWGHGGGWLQRAQVKAPDTPPERGHPGAAPCPAHLSLPDSAKSNHIADFWCQRAPPPPPPLTFSLIKFSNHC